MHQLQRFAFKRFSGLPSFPAREQLGFVMSMNAFGSVFVIVHVRRDSFPHELFGDCPFCLIGQFCFE